MPDYRKDQKQRPWDVEVPASGTKEENARRKLFRMWLLERGGVVVYQCQLLDVMNPSPTFMPARFVAEEDDKLHDAPMRIGVELVSTMKEQTDHVTLEEYDNDVEKTLDQAFVFKQEVQECPKPKKRKSSSRSTRKGR